MKLLRIKLSAATLCVLLVASAVYAQNLFQPTGMATTITCGIATDNAQLTDVGTNTIGSSLRIANKGTNAFWVKTGTGSIEATVTDFIVLPDSISYIRRPSKHTHVACITGTSTSAGEFQPGNGF